MFNESKSLLNKEKNLPITVQMKIDDMNNRIGKLSKE